MSDPPDRHHSVHAKTVSDFCVEFVAGHILSRAKHTEQRGARSESRRGRHVLEVTRFAVSRLSRRASTEGSGVVNDVVAVRERVNVASGRQTDDR